ERPHGPRARALHERDDERGIDAAREECPDRHVRDHLQANRLLERVMHLRESLPGLPRRLCHDRRGLTVLLLADGERTPVARYRQQAAGGNLAHALINTVRRWDVAAPQVKCERIAADFRAEGAMFPECFELGAEDQPAVVERIIERLL